jgi:hypothetical protein
MDERWSGKVDATVNEHARRLNDINGHVRDMAQAVVDLRVTIARIAVGASLLAVLANAFVALIVYQLTR